MSEIKRIYYTLKESAKFIGISVEELRRRIKYLKIPLIARGSSFVIHCLRLPKIVSYRETLENENKRLKKEIKMLRKKLE